MISKKIRYYDYNDVAHEETFYFNLSKAEIAELQFSDKDDTLSDMMTNLGDDNTSAQKALEIFKKVIAKAVGERSDDGARFIKTDTIRNDFMQTEAYSELLFELMEDPKGAADFLTKLFPKNAQEEIKTKLKGRDLSDLSEDELAELRKQLDSQDK